MIQNDYLRKKKPLQDKKLIEDFKIPPHSKEAEQSILGGLMLDNDKWDDIVDKIYVRDFFIFSHREIFVEMQHLMEIGKPIDLITLSESLEQSGKLESIGGFSYLAELSKNTFSVSNIIAYAEIVRERSILRKIASIANEIADSVYDPKGRTSIDLINLAESKIFQISENWIQKGTGPKKIDYFLGKTMNKIEKFYKNPCNGITGISSGYLDLDKKTFGLQKSDFIVVAARPSMGKTTFAMNICENAAINEDKPVLIFSLEMSGEQIMMRILSSLSRVDQSRIRTGKLSDEDWSKISVAVETILEKRNMYIDDSSRLTPMDVQSRSRRIFRENHGLSLIMIDYLQLMHVPSFSENRTLEIAEISRSLKSLAKELKVPVLALSQLNRSLEQRSNKRPINSDLRESGSIEQDADLIIFIYRDEIYHENSNFKGIAEIILGKQRNGPIGTIKLAFNGKWSRFDNYAEE